MKKPITISIPEPCHEEWQEMTPTEKGKFCDSCAKEVFDFTTKSDDQIVAFVAKNPNACGRFKKNQTGRELKMERKSRINLTPYAASLLLPFTLLGNSNPTSTTPNLSKSEYVSLGIGRYSNMTSDQKKIQFSGVVRDEDGNGISNVKISVRETGISVISGLNGHYEISFLNHQTLVFQKEDFEIIEVRASKNSEEKNILLLSKSNPVSNVVGKLVTNPIENETVIIRGTVTDNQGIPLPGANIIVNGTTNGTQSAFDGTYSITVPPGSELIYSYVGYSERRITTANINASLTIQLEESFDILGEMVIVAGGISVLDTPPELTPAEKAAKKLQQETANKNQQRYREIKQARKKQERLEKRNKKRN